MSNYPLPPPLPKKRTYPVIGPGTWKDFPFLNPKQSRVGRNPSSNFCCFFQFTFLEFWNCPHTHTFHRCSSSLYLPSSHSPPGAGVVISHFFLCWLMPTMVCYRASPRIKTISFLFSTKSDFRGSHLAGRVKEVGVETSFPRAPFV
jgi:hypothetical protein